MDPLKLSNLHAANDWNAFMPDATGYIPPQQLELHPDCAEIKLREFTSADYMLSDYKPVDSWRDFTLPLSSREMSFLPTHLGVGAGGELPCIMYPVGAIPDDRGATSLVPRLSHLSGALPSLRDAFCLWRHALNCSAPAPTPAPALLPFFLGGSPESASEFTRYDATLLCHLAPLAKAYGFKMYAGVLMHTLSTAQEVYHSYKEYFGLNGDDLDPSDLRMSGDLEVDYEWTELRTFAGVGVDDLEPALVDRAVEMVETRAFQEQLMKVD
ncbi:hypothetical protein DFH09DRAFT_1301686 [Mycena vulgaris]|nr:hypothetical protein DFH09DRAFT_1301686 [Mycena vulgaris]